MVDIIEKRGDTYEEERRPDWFVPANLEYYDAITYALGWLGFEERAMEDLLRKQIRKSLRVQIIYQLYAYKEAKKYILSNLHMHPADVLEILWVTYYHLSEDCISNTPSQRMAVVADTLESLRDMFRRGSLAWRG